jgi:hypothetical protein
MSGSLTTWTCVSTNIATALPAGRLAAPSRGQKSATRGQSIIHSYCESVDFAGFVSLSAKATYGDITSVTWHAASSGCSSPTSRLLWRDGYTVPNAPIVQANCFVRPSP